MKKSKLSRLAALLAAGALLLGGMFISCSSDDDSGSTPTPAVDPDDTDDTLDEIAGTYTFGDSDVVISADGTVTITTSSGTTTGTAVIEDGTLTISAGGSTLYTAEVSDGEIELDSVKDSDKNSVTASVKTVAVTSVTVTTSGETTIEVGKSVTLTATVKPTDATDKTVTWTITEGADYVEKTDNSDGSVTLTGKAAGTVKVSATAGGVTSDAVTVTVVAFGSLEGTIY